MKEEEWNQLLQRGNGQFFQMVSCFRKSPRGKIDPRSRKDLLRTVAESLGAMANAGGGTVLLGVDTGEETLGVYFSEPERRLFQDLLREAFEPSLEFQIAAEVLLGRTLLCFRVPPSQSFIFEERKIISPDRFPECSSLPGESGGPAERDAPDRP
jgi:predicted HTH transcriptional regulator